MDTQGDNERLILEASGVLARLRAERPRVHCLTNFVAMQLTANLLLAAGAVPSMTMDAAEMPAFVESSRALLVNLGMLDPWRQAAIPAALDAAAGLDRPWVLDPVKVDRAPHRREFAADLLGRGPAVLRCNAVEAAMLEPGPHIVTAVTGATDAVRQGDRRTRLGGGTPLMDRVTAMGCAASGLVAACLAVETDPYLATVSGLLVMKVAGAMAAEKAGGPGSFAPLFLDAVFGLDAATLQKRAQLT